jgi:gluconolactonase
MRIVDDKGISDLLRSSAARREASGFQFTEGPLWIPEHECLLFSDIPADTIYRWAPGGEAEVYRHPSHHSNGLTLDNHGNILACEHTGRRVSIAAFGEEPEPLVEHYDGKRFNSPNDLVLHGNGAVFFTDPPYGLKDLDDSPAKELDFNGVYRIDTDGAVHLVDDGLSFPNGIALSPDGRTLYVANSDPQRPIWMAYSLDEAGNVVDKRVFADASDLVGEDVPGLPDGMAVSSDGHLFATGPGGVIVFDAVGNRLGRIETGSAIANCAFGDDGRTLYMTSHTFLARVPVNATGLGF